MILALSAAEELQDIMKSAKRVPATSSMREFLTIVGLAVALGLIVAIWAVYFRKKRKRRGADYSRPKPVAPAEQGKLSRSKRRRRHRPLNPTRAETGGLPPIRSHKNNAR